MNIGYITHTPPYPPDEGAKIVTYHRLKGLVERGHNVYLLSLVEPDYISEVPQPLTDLCSDVKYVRRDKSIHSLLNDIRLPFSVTSRTVPEAKEHLNNLESKLDILIGDHTFTAAYLTDVNTPTCLSVHNIEWKGLLGNARSLLPSPTSSLYLADALRMYLFEKEIYKSQTADSFVFLSEQELRKVTDDYPGISNRSWHSPVGINTSNFKDLNEPKLYDDSSYKIVFTGTMRYPPNVDAVQWFANQIFPKVRTQLSDVEFFIVGKSPTSKIKKLGHKSGVTVTGRVDDVNSYISNADVSVVPVREGAGVQVKLLEALAAGNPTISTKFGAQGLKVKDKKHLLIRNTSSSFAKGILSVLLNTDDGDTLGKNGQHLVHKEYSWESIINDFESKLKSTAL